MTSAIQQRTNPAKIIALALVLGSCLARSARGSRANDRAAPLRSDGGALCPEVQDTWCHASSAVSGVETAEQCTSDARGCLVCTCVPRTNDPALQHEY